MPLQSVRDPVNMHIDSNSGVTKVPFRSELQSCQKYGIHLHLPSSLQSQKRHLWAYTRERTQFINSLWDIRVEVVSQFLCGFL